MTSIPSIYQGIRNAGAMHEDNLMLYLHISTLHSHNSAQMNCDVEKMCLSSALLSYNWICFLNLVVLIIGSSSPSVDQGK